MAHFENLLFWGGNLKGWSRFESNNLGMHFGLAIRITKNMSNSLQLIFRKSRGETRNPFLVNVPLLYTLKTSENLQFSDVFRVYRNGTLVEEVEEVII